VESKTERAPEIEDQEKLVHKNLHDENQKRHGHQ
jgi:hypothetical protein